MIQRVSNFTKANGMGNLGDFNWDGLVAAIAAGGTAAANALRAANTYPYPYGNPYSQYPGGVNQGMVGAYQQGGPGALAQYQIGQSSGSIGISSSMLLILGLGMMMFMMMGTMRR